ncbi:hypothetical protein SCHPADRAFT_733121 [Schizopora paradoxa]|uniref:Uncharacterized protein n=1 Tax=Schizopora paradoxa TaxID=27342 RepID=A0A0H2R0F7_9AGAM|nr:hypothetical protein SCHPADRAFT_733121 [Schizopora paradoxa]
MLFGFRHDIFSVPGHFELPNSSIKMFYSAPITAENSPMRRSSIFLLRQAYSLSKRSPLSRWRMRTMTPSGPRIQYSSYNYGLTDRSQ